MPRRQVRPYETLTNWEKQLDRWVKLRLWREGHPMFNNGQYGTTTITTDRQIVPLPLYPDGWKKSSLHETNFGCKIWFTDVEFGIGSTGACETCYHEYPAVLFNWNCEKLCPHGQRLTFRDEIRDYNGAIQLQTILAELEEVR